MLPPHELKNKNFSRVLRGYNSVEVDEQINFIIEKYTELYRQNDELERKLKTAEAKLAEFRADEESIRSALVNAQKASAKIIGEANERADVIIRSAKTNCNKVIANFRNELQKEREDLQTLRRAVGEFKARLFAQYQQHISYIEEISPDVEADDADMPDEVFVRRVVNRVKNDIASGKVAPNATPDDDTDINATTAKNTAETQSGQQPPQPPAPAIKEITRVPSAENALQQSADNKAEDEEDGGGYLDDMLDDADLTDIDDTKSYTSASNAAANNAVANNAAASNASANNASASNAVANNAVAKAADKPNAAEEKPKTIDASDTVMFDIVKPNSRPSTLSGAASKQTARSFISSDNDGIMQTGGHQGAQSTYRSASVKDAIRELNLKFAGNGAEEDDEDKDIKLAGQPGTNARAQQNTPVAADDTSEDDELLSMIRSVSGASNNSGEKDNQGANNKNNKNNKKNKTKPLSITEEFDLISDDDEKI